MFNRKRQEDLKKDADVFKFLLQVFPLLRRRNKNSPPRIYFLRRQILISPASRRLIFPSNKNQVKSQELALSIKQLDESDSLKDGFATSFRFCVNLGTAKSLKHVVISLEMDKTFAPKFGQNPGFQD